MLKKQGRVKMILAGPNLVTRANEFNGLIASNAVDICIVPSLWVQKAYEEDMPSLKGKIRVWFAGIDTEYWRPTPRLKDKVLVYWKTEPVLFCEQVECCIKEKGFDPFRVHYGKYTKEQFKTYLDQSLFAVFISISESQGLALAECWSMNVATLVWNPQTMQAHGRIYSEVSACPYLTSQTGKDWQQLSHLELLLNNHDSWLYQPRQWVLENMTYKHSAERMITIIKEFIDVPYWHKTIFAH
jgi:hypothetical protein